MSDGATPEETEKEPSGLGPDGSIPVTKDGISLGWSPEASNFNQEEDPDVEMREVEDAAEPE